MKGSWADELDFFIYRVMFSLDDNTRACWLW